MRLRALVLLLAATSVAMAGSFVKSEKEVSYDTRPKGSEWLGEWRPKLSEEEVLRRWADAARQRLGVVESKGKVAERPASATASAAPASSLSSR